MLNFSTHQGYNDIDNFVSEWDDCIIIIFYRKDVGYVRIRQYKDMLNSINIEELFINNMFRKSGIGSLFMGYIIDFCHLNNITIVDLTVKIDSWMKEWYKRWGFYEYETLNDKYMKLIRIV